MPFVELNGKHFHDSGLIIRELTEHFGKEALLGQNEEKNAIGVLIDEMMERAFIP